MITAILDPTEQNIARAADALGRGEIVGMPTETVYGLAAAVFDELAVAAVFAAKSRPVFDPLIVHVARGSGRNGREHLESLRAARLVDLELFGSSALNRASLLAESFWPGPLTIVLPKDSAVPDLVTSGLSTVALRMPRHPVAQALIAAAGTPVAAPSANRFGRISPTSAADVVAELAGRIPLVLDGGPCEVGLESSVVAIGLDGTLTLLRPGGVSREEIASAAGAPVALGKRPSGIGPRSAPGQLGSHYAPEKALRILEASAVDLASHDVAQVQALVPAGAAAGLLVAHGDATGAGAAFQRATGRRTISRSLSRSGNSIEAARTLFSSLRALDASEAVALFAEPWTDAEGLGYAIADRLQKAAASRDE